MIVIKMIMLIINMIMKIIIIIITIVVIRQRGTMSGDDGRRPWSEKASAPA